MSNSRPHVLHLTVLNPARHTRIFHKLAWSQFQQGWQVTIAGQDAAEEPYEENGIQIIPIRPFQRLSWRRWWVRRKLLKLSLQLRPEVVTIHTPELLGVARKIHQTTGARIWYDVHEDYAANIRHATHYPDWLKGWLANRVRKTEKKALSWLWQVSYAEECYDGMLGRAVENSSSQTPFASTPLSEQDNNDPSSTQSFNPVDASTASVSGHTSTALPPQRTGSMTNASSSSCQSCNPDDASTASVSGHTSSALPPQRTGSMTNDSSSSCQSCNPVVLPNLFPAHLANHPDRSVVPDQTYYLYCGTIAREWGVLYAIDWWERLYQHKSHPLVIAGHCAQPGFWEELKTRIRQSPLSEHIRVIGGREYVPYLQIVALIQHCEAGFGLYDPLPHLAKKVPTKFYEFLALGKPLIYPEAGFWKEFGTRHPLGVGVGEETKESDIVKALDAWKPAEDRSGYEWKVETVVMGNPYIEELQD